MKINKNGFTLVELLIVIALIAILSVAVLATINPIEQSNKARDVKFKNDAAEVLSAYERYYASLNAYPWMRVATAPVATIDVPVVYRSNDAHFGILPDGASTDTEGLLITSTELKGSFMGKDYFKAGLTEEDAMYVYHNGDDNYVCYHPKAAVNRVLVDETSTTLKCLDATSTPPVIYNYRTDSDENGCAIPGTGWDSTSVSATNANLVCVPEGMIQ